VVYNRRVKGETGFRSKKKLRRGREEGRVEIKKNFGLAGGHGGCTGGGQPGGKKAVSLKKGGGVQTKRGTPSPPESKFPST